MRSHWKGVRVPKQVDHQARREQIADAVCRLAASRGLDAVSLRHVAAAAGVSMGRVQHYFATKDDMLMFAFETIGKRVERRMAAAVGDIPPGTRAFVRALLVEMLPLNDASRAEAPVLAAFFAKAVVEPRLARPLREDAPAMAGFVAEQLATAGVERPDTAAVTLLALVDGLMLHLLVGQVAETDALAALDGYLDRILG